MYYGARFYDPQIGLFVSLDTIVPDAGRVFGYNRTMYVAGNPLRLRDSSGHFWETALDVASVGYDVYDIYENGLTWSSAGSLAVDVAGAAIPFVPSAGACVRWCDEAAQVGGKAAGWVGDKAGDAWRWTKGALGYGDDAAQAVNTICSFSEETLVATSEGLKPISELKAGELVLAYNEATGETGYYPILDVFAHNDPQLVFLTIDGETITTTPEHPFYEAESAPWLASGEFRYNWTPAEGLKVGDFVRSADGTLGRVAKVQMVDRQQVMYNLTVAEAHTFFVGEEGWLVHNSCFGVVKYGAKAADMNNHHGIMDAWAAANISGYVSRASGAPTVQMGVEAHTATTKVFRDWLTENYGQPVGVKVDWTKVSRQEIYNLSERMFDAAGVPKSVREQYYSALDQYTATGQWE